MAILALDAAWGSTGWALTGPKTVVDCGHVKLGGKAWRWAALADWFRDHLDPLLLDLELCAEPPFPPRVVVEVPPAVYQRGNQAVVGYGMGILCGPILLEAARRPDLGYPWEVKPDEWRAWWNLKGKGRAEKKRVAIALARQLGHGRHLDRFAESADEDLAPRSDVAEAILIGLAAARHHKDAPKGPARGGKPIADRLPLQPRRGHT